MPRAFRFRLQALLDRRTYDEQRAEQIVAAAAHAHDDALCGIDALIDGIRLRIDELSRRGSTLSAWEREIFERHVAALESEIAQAKRTADLRAAELDCAHTQLRATQRARGIVEQLRERARRAYDAEEARLEELELDDINARQHERARRLHAAHPSCR